MRKLMQKGPINRGLLVILLFGFSLAVTLGRDPSPVSAVPRVPHSFFGVVTGNGTSVGSGVKIEARIGNVHYGHTADSAGDLDQDTQIHAVDGSGFNYGTQSIFRVCADDNATDEIEGGATGDEITFYIDDIEATPSEAVTFSQGSETRIDLIYDPSGATVAATPSDDACTVASSTPTPIPSVSVWGVVAMGAGFVVLILVSVQARGSLHRRVRRGD